MILLAAERIAEPVAENFRKSADIGDSRGAGCCVADVGGLRGDVVVCQLGHETQVEALGGWVVEDGEGGDVFGSVPGRFWFCLREGEDEAGDREGEENEVWNEHFVCVVGCVVLFICLR